jgi:hypothetical protein
MNMLGNGLRAWEVGSYGGWGGRAVGNEQGVDFSSGDTSANAMATNLSAVNSQANQSAKEWAYLNFFPAAQRDFAARLKWSVTPKYANANHEPVVKIEGPLNVLASAGEKIRLNGAVSDLMEMQFPLSGGSFMQEAIPVQWLSQIQIRRRLKFLFLRMQPLARQFTLFLKPQTMARQPLQDTNE